jgi:hypothetical protein
MLRFYKTKIIKKPVGSAIEHILPAFEGKVITNVYDITTDGDFRLFVVDCTDEENRVNIALSGVSELSLEDAVALAAQFQPARKIMTFNPETRTAEEQDIPELDLKVYLS